MIIVSDTSPLNYLILIEQIDVLHQLYGQVIVPGSVHRELQAAETPDVVRSWLSNHPNWIEVMSVSSPVDLDLDYLGEGERDAILLAKELGAGRLTHRRSRRPERSPAAETRVIGTLGVLAAAAEKRLLDLSQAVERLKATTFRASPRLYDALLKRFATD